MSLDESNPPVSIEQAMQYARDDLIQQFEAFAQQEADKGDGRAKRLVERFVESLRRKK